MIVLDRIRLTDCQLKEIPAQAGFSFWIKNKNAPFLQSGNEAF